MQALTVADFTQGYESLPGDVYKWWKKHNDLRQDQLERWSETRKYVYATDTEYTSSTTSPWKNKTTRNKLCRLYDMLVTLYSKNLMPNEDFKVAMRYFQSIQ